MSALDTQVAGSHYKDCAIQPVEYIHANGLGFCEGSVVKYVTRWRAKGGVADLEKARHFLDLLIELEGRKNAPLASDKPLTLMPLEEPSAAVRRRCEDCGNRGVVSACKECLTNPGRPRWMPRADKLFGWVKSC